jgi:hypothetical protein
MRDDVTIEHRLSREARERIGTLSHPDIPRLAAQSGICEVYWVEDRNDERYERAGQFLVYVPVTLDPWEAIREVVEAELEQRGERYGWQNWEVSDIYSY